MEKLIKKYEELCAIPYVRNGDAPYSDISYHLPRLRELASECSVVVELGVRRGHSTVALLNGVPEMVYSYDLVKWDDVNEIEALCKEYGLGFKFEIGNSLAIEIPECDFLWIDSFHTCSQLERELARHAHKAKKYLGFHDVSRNDGGFWEKGEESYEAVSGLGVNCGRGLKYAIEPFMAAHPEWKEVYRTDVNNGILILGKV